MGANGNERLRFGDFEFDSQSGKLFRDGVLVKIHPQPLRVLQLLVERPGETISREQLRSHIWGGVTFVEFDQALNYCIRQIRIALSDNAVEPAYVETLPKQGYRFIAEVVGGVKGATADAAREQQPGAQTLLNEPARNAPNRNLLRWLPISALAVGVFALLVIAG